MKSDSENVTNELNLVEEAAVLTEAEKDINHYARIDALHGNLEGLRKGQAELKEAGMLKKAEKAEAVLNEACDLLANLVHEAHSIRAGFEHFKNHGNI